VFALVAIIDCKVYDPDLVGMGPSDASAGAGSRFDALIDTRGGDDFCLSAGGAGGTECTGGTAGIGGAGGAMGGMGGLGTGGASGSNDATAGAAGSMDAAAGAAGSKDAAGGAAGSKDAAGGAAGTNDAADGPGGGGGTAGTFGCDADVDATCRDGAADAEGGIVDNCPGDPAKTEPGVCGCGVPDTDTDGDGTSDCVDGCPTDPKKTQLGICGCNADDPSVPDAGEAFCLKALLAHRYSFDGTGTVATDSIGTAHGAIVGGANATLSGGSLSLTGDLGAGFTTEGYVSLPGNILAGLTSATFEVWITWRGPGAQGNRQWQRIFEFGDQAASGSNQVGHSYLFLTPYATSSGILRAAYSVNGSANETIVNAPSAFPTGALQHVAVVIDDPGDTMALYFNGAAAGNVPLAGLLSAINNVNSWLGRSGYSVDPELNGIFEEFRIYKTALTAAQIQTSYAAGPSPPFF
jgi:hypothetical protein